MVHPGLPRWCSGKESTCQAGDARDAHLIPGSGRSVGEGNGQPTLVLLPGKFHGQRSLVGYSPWGQKESDKTELLSTYTHYRTQSVCTNPKLFKSTFEIEFYFGSVQSLSCVRFFATPRIAARQASLSITNSRSSLKLLSIDSVMPSTGM